MKSRVVSFRPPLKPLVRGVRIARVITTSSGFFWVLFGHAWLANALGMTVRKTTYMADNPLLLGVRWLRMELSLSVAIVESSANLVNRCERMARNAVVKGEKREIPRMFVECGEAEVQINPILATLRIKPQIRPPARPTTYIYSVRTASTTSPDRKL